MQHRSQPTSERSPLCLCPDSPKAQTYFPGKSSGSQARPEPQSRCTSPGGQECAGRADALGRGHPGECV